jgi:hypothetical protein
MQGMDRRKTLVGNRNETNVLRVSNTDDVPWGIDEI